MVYCRYFNHLTKERTVMDQEMDYVLEEDLPYPALAAEVVIRLKRILYYDMDADDCVERFAYDDGITKEEAIDSLLLDVNTLLSNLVMVTHVMNSALNAKCVMRLCAHLGLRPSYLVRRFASKVMQALLDNCDLSKDAERNAALTFADTSLQNALKVDERETERIARRKAK
jgi:hypothetical protein